MPYPSDTFCISIYGQDASFVWHAEIPFVGSPGGSYKLEPSTPNRQGYMFPKNGGFEYWILLNNEDGIGGFIPPGIMPGEAGAMPFYEHGVDVCKGQQKPPGDKPPGDKPPVTPPNMPPGSPPCCEPLGPILSTIGEALADIADALKDALKFDCSKLKECMSDIVEALTEELNKTTYTCEQCKSEAGTSLANSLAYKINCAQYAGRDCEPTEPSEECPSGTNDGEPCTTCGEAPCCCKLGSCEPCETPPEEACEEWAGYCNPQTGLYQILKCDQPIPPSPWVRILTGVDQQAVHAATNAACRQQRPPESPITPLPDLPTFNSRACNLDIYSSAGGIRTLFPQNSAIDISSALIQTSDHFSDSVQTAVKFIPLAEGIVKAIYGFGKLPFLAARGLAPAIASALGCSEPLWKSVYETMIGFGYVEKELGIDLGEAKRPFTYAMNTLCRNRYQTLDGATGAYLANQISYDRLSTLGGMDGYCQDAIKWHVGASRAKPVPQQLYLMRHREIIDETEYHAGMRRLGYLEPSVRTNLWKASFQVPTLTDIIRFMVRDADDNTLAGRLGLDDFFDQKYQDQLKKWSKDQGIPDKVAKYAWRAHWTIPSPGQLFTFYHRLRNTPEFGPPAKLMEDIKAALIQQDILPHWHDHYLAVSFRPLTRVDTRRAFELGSVDRAAMIKAYLDQGYSDDNAEILAKFNERQRELGATRHRFVKLWHKLLITRDDARDKMIEEGLPADVVDRALDTSEVAFYSTPFAATFVRGDITRLQFTNKLAEIGVSEANITMIANALAYKRVKSPALKRFTAGLVDRSDAAQEAVDDGMNFDVANNILGQIESTVDSQLAANCQRGIRKRYLLAEFDQEAAATHLTRYGITLTRANKLVAAWDCSRSAIGKHIPANTLCRYLERGIITPQQFIERLQRLGFSEQSAGMMVHDCLISIDVRRAADAKKRMKDEEAEAIKAERQIAQAQAKREKLRKQLEQATKQAAATRLRRNKQLMSAAEKIADRCHCGFYNGMETVKQGRNQLVDQFGFSVDDALQILMTTAEGWDGGELADYQNHLLIAAGGGEPEPIAEPESAENNGVASNGSSQPSGPFVR